MKFFCRQIILLATHIFGSVTLSAGITGTTIGDFHLIGVTAMAMATGGIGAGIRHIITAGITHSIAAAGMAVGTATIGTAATTTATMRVTAEQTAQ